jgi:hypothetical protein
MMSKTGTCLRAQQFDSLVRLPMAHARAHCHEEAAACDAIPCNVATILAARWPGIGTRRLCCFLVSDEVFHAMTFWGPKPFFWVGGKGNCRSGVSNKCKCLQARQLDSLVRLTVAHAESRFARGSHCGQCAGRYQVDGVQHATLLPGLNTGSGVMCLGILLLCWLLCWQEEC